MNNKESTMRSSPTTSLLLMVKGMRQIAKEINDLAPQSEARKNVVYPSIRELDELLDLSDAIHFFDDLAHSILNDDLKEAISNTANRSISKLFDQYYKYGQSSFSYPKMEYRAKYSDCMDYGKPNYYMLEKITFDREIQQLPLTKENGNYQFNKRNLVNVKQERHTVFTFDPTPIQNQTINREVAIVDLMDGLRSLRRCADRADMYWNTVDKPQVLMEIDFTKEFAQLVLAISKIAIEIRLYSSYAGEYASGQCKHIPSAAMQEIHDLSNAILIATEIIDVFNQGSIGVLINKVLELKQQLSCYCEFTSDNVFSRTNIFDRHEYYLPQNKDVAAQPLNSITTLYRHNFEVDTMPEILKNLIERTKISMDKVECRRDITYTIDPKFTRLHLAKALVSALDGFIRKVVTFKAA